MPKDADDDERTDEQYTQLCLLLATVQSGVGRRAECDQRFFRVFSGMATTL